VRACVRACVSLCVHACLDFGNLLIDLYENFANFITQEAAGMTYLQ